MNCWKEGFETVKEDDLLKLINEEIAKIDEVRLYYELKVRRLHYLSKPHQKRYLKVVIALAKLKLPITANMIQAVLGQEIPTILYPLHNLGDKHLLVLKRQDGKSFEWIPSDLLSKIINVLEA